MKRRLSILGMFVVFCLLLAPVKVDAGIFSQFFGVQSAATIKKPVIAKAQSKKKGEITLTWKKISDAERYEVWGTTKANGTFTRLKVVKGAANVSYTHKNLTNGKRYYYKLVAKKKSNGVWVENSSDTFAVYCNYFAHKNESYTDKCKRAFGKNYYQSYATSSEAEKHMKTITVKVWDLNGSSWYTRRYSMKVNKNMAPTIQQMFEDLYKLKKSDRVPIHALGCYSWRGTRSEHDEGLAIDINWEENYMIDNGKILAGKFWNPKKSKYSIPLKCKFVTIIEKYGFTRGFWGNRKDYMHFSYFGT